MKQRSVSTPRIVQPGNQYPVGQWLLVAVLCVIALAIWWPQLPWSSPLAPPVVSLTQLQAVQQQLTTTQAARDTWRLRAINAERTHQVDQSALDKAQQTLQSLQDERATLRHELEFLKSLVSGDVTVLQLLGFKIWSPDQTTPGKYGYALTVSKRAKSRTKVRGTLQISVVGQQAGKSVALSMTDLGINPNNLTMKFTHFQSFSGEFVLPEGFIPHLVRVAVQPAGKQFRQYQKDILWRLIEGPLH